MSSPSIRGWDTGCEGQGRACRTAGDPGVAEWVTPRVSRQVQEGHVPMNMGVTSASHTGWVMADALAEATSSPGLAGGEESCRQSHRGLPW